MKDEPKLAISEVVAHWMRVHKAAEQERIEKTQKQTQSVKVAVKVKAKIDPDSDKARALVGKAIRQRDLSKLKELVEDEGLAIDVVRNAKSEAKIAVMECLEHNFLEGLHYLIDRGAPRAWEFKKKSGHLELFLHAGTDESGKPVPLTSLGSKSLIFSGVRPDTSNLLDVAFDRQQVDFIEALWEREPEKIQKNAAGRCHGTQAYKFLVSKGYEACVSIGEREKLCVDFLQFFLRAQKEEIEKGIKLGLEAKEDAGLYKSLLANLSVQGRAMAWHAILSMDQIEVLSEVVKKGLAPTTSMPLVISPKDLYGTQAYMHTPSSYTVREAKGEALVPREYHLEELVCFLSALSKDKVLLKAVLLSEESRKKVENSQEALWALASDPNLEIIQCMKKVGFNLDKLVNEKGYNPLHYAVQRRKSEAQILELARMNPQWIMEKNNDKKRPQDLLDVHSGVKDLGRKLEELVIKKAVGNLNKGKRTKAIRI